MEQSLWFLHKYIAEAAQKGEHLDHVLVPILQHVHDFLYILFFFSFRLFHMHRRIRMYANLEIGSLHNGYSECYHFYVKM